MTHIETSAENYAKHNYNKATDSYVVSKESFEEGADYMLERVLDYLKFESPTFFDHFGEEIRKAMEE